jgi:hypothetical protein
MRSRISSAVVFGSIVAGFSSGAGGGLTVAHSVVMSFARAGKAASAATSTANAATPHNGEVSCQAKCFMIFLPILVYVDECLALRPDSLARISLPLQR